MFLSNKTKIRHSNHGGTNTFTTTYTNIKSETNTKRDRQRESE